jgi:hypothetical protein
LGVLQTIFGDFLEVTIFGELLSVPVRPVFAAPNRATVGG